MPDLPPASAPSAKSPRTHHIFVDYENIHQIHLSLVTGKPVIVHLVLGSQQKNLAVPLVEQLLAHPHQFRLIKAEKSGKNALDFILSYHVGVASVADPKGYFHIVSRDKGFDALILHLKNNDVLARRDDTFAQAFEATDATPIPSTLADRLQIVTERLAKNEKSRPKKKKTLLSQINAYFQKKLTEPELAEIIQQLATNKVIQIGDKNEVVYQP